MTTSENIFFIPIRKTASAYERLISFEAVVTFRPSAQASPRGQEFKEISQLQSGRIYKINVPADGIFKLDHAFLSAHIEGGVGSVNPDAVHLLSNGGGPLAEAIMGERIDDVEEVAMMPFGMNDGSIDPGDYFLFYGEGPDKWDYRASDQRFHMTRNIYADHNSYFIKIGGTDARRIATIPSATNPERIISEFNAYVRFEDDRVNLLGRFRNPGSGKQWFGDEFSATRERDYDEHFLIPNIVPGSALKFDVLFAGRSNITSTYYVDINNQTFSKNITRVNLGNGEDDYARNGKISGTVPAASGDQQSIAIRYPQSGSSSSGWLDYIQMNALRALRMHGRMMSFRALDATDFSVVQYDLSGISTQMLVWDITDPLMPANIEVIPAAQSVSFGVETDGVLKEYVAFENSGDYPVPEFVAAVANQNLHGIQRAELAIIYHPLFEDAALRLARHREDHSGLEVVATSTEEVYNEFAGGVQDPTAIREFARMLFERSDDFRYLLLVGDGTYDMRHRIEGNPDDNFIVTYESNESLDPIRSFPSDDYFALLNDANAERLIGAIDIAVGRLPVGTVAEADAVVNKLLSYDLSSRSLGDWRLRAAFVADDEDSNLHLRQTDNLALDLDLNHPLLNQEKIYQDAFQQQSTPGGERYPQVNAAINENIFKGVLVMNYLGHGGHNGWAQERVLTVQDILSWNNYERLPLFVTATCSFTGYDEPSYTSAGEHVLLNPVGGAVGLFTTTRAVYSSSNERLTREVFERIFKRYDGAYLPIGEVMRLAKNTNSADTLEINARKFAVIGDPSMHLALPQFNVVATTINGMSTSGGNIDTLKALEKVTISGEVRSLDDKLISDFNGKLYTTVFDKKLTARTLANDSGSSQRDFKIQNKVIFKGVATIDGGRFSFSFVVPKDINFDYGNGKISFYATDEVDQDAAGEYQGFLIGGATNDISDNEGPEINLYMDNENFVSGGTTGRNTTLIVKLFDQSGINVVGSSIGHDLEGVLDNDSQNSFILNDFYTATLDDYTSGEARYPLFDLDPGLHQITVTAWDIANNFSEAEIDFIVSDDAKEALRNLLNYPNPFSANTLFQFEHSLGPVAMDVFVEIFNLAGQKVKTIEAVNVIPDGSLVDGIEWNGTSDSGGPLAHGLYVYRVRVAVEGNGSGDEIIESAFEKLVLLK